MPDWLFFVQVRAGPVFRSTLKNKLNLKYMPDLRLRKVNMSKIKAISNVPEKLKFVGLDTFLSFPGSNAQGILVPFVFDSGADITCISRKTLRELGVDPPIKERRVLSVADGASVESDIIDVDVAIICSDGSKPVYIRIEATIMDSEINLVGRNLYEFFDVWLRAAELIWIAPNKKAFGGLVEPDRTYEIGYNW